MKFKICHNCGETVASLNEKCPKCGIVPEKSISPVFMGVIIAAAVLLLAVAGLVFL